MEEYNKNKPSDSEPDEEDSKPAKSKTKSSPKKKVSG